MDNILDLIPQRAPIVMVDEFLGIDENLSRTRFAVYKDNIFVEDNRLSECGLIEHIAQSAAARIGYIFRSKNQAVPIGYIGSVNDFSILRHPAVGEQIFTTIEVLQEVLGITLIRAVCCVAGEQIASCKMKIFLNTDEA
ncbi:MAG: hydroxymyristoyl-ACP dehydratase [Alistipes sp.]|nr:hydroxymyristoyl-ACP dehydratase [Alistipes sp.]